MDRRRRGRLPLEAQLDLYDARAISAETLRRGRVMSRFEIARLLRERERAKIFPSVKCILLAQAARLISVSPSTLRFWIEGGRAESPASAFRRGCRSGRRCAGISRRRRSGSLRPRSRLSAAARTPRVGRGMSPPWPSTSSAAMEPGRRRGSGSPSPFSSAARRFSDESPCLRHGAEPARQLLSLLRRPPLARAGRHSAGGRRLAGSERRARPAAGEGDLFSGRGAHCDGGGDYELVNAGVDLGPEPHVPKRKKKSA